MEYEREEGGRPGLDPNREFLGVGGPPDMNIHEGEVHLGPEVEESEVHVGPEVIRGEDEVITEEDIERETMPEEDILAEGEPPYVDGLPEDTAPDVLGPGTTLPDEEEEESDEYYMQ